MRQVQINRNETPDEKNLEATKVALNLTKQELSGVTSSLHQLTVEKERVSKAAEKELEKARKDIETLDVTMKERRTHLIKEIEEIEKQAQKGRDTLVHVVKANQDAKVDYHSSTEHLETLRRDLANIEGIIKAGENKIEEKHQELCEVNNNITKVKSDLEAVKKQTFDQVDESTRLSKEIEHKNAGIINLNLTIEQKREVIRGLEGEVNGLESKKIDLTAQNTALAQKYDKKMVELDERESKAVKREQAAQLLIDTLVTKIDIAKKMETVGELKTFLNEVLKLK